MSSLFARRKGVEEQRIPVMVPEKSAREMGFSFEPLREEIVDECVDSISKAMPHMRLSKERLRGGLLLPSSLTIVARRRGAVVGMVSGTVYEMPHPPPTIVLMVVLDEESGRGGLGGYLIDEFIKVARGRSPKASFVDVSLPSSDSGSIALYSLKGFVIEGFVKEGYNPSFVGEGSRDLVILRRRFMPVGQAASSGDSD